jgi:hypothetical protein
MKYYYYLLFKLIIMYLLVYLTFAHVYIQCIYSLQVMSSYPLRSILLQNQLSHLYEIEFRN